MIWAAIRTCSRIRTDARHFDVVDAATVVDSRVGFELSIGRLIHRPDRADFASQPSFIGAITLENTATNSVKGMYWFSETYTARVLSLLN